DYTIWWIFNDRGNIHTESGGESIGMEIRGQAFSFATNDEINDMTFYNYELINRSTQTLEKTYFGQNVDPDLGCGRDDYVGCDVGRGLGFAYNGDDTDDNCTGGAIPYGTSPPAIGVDFFEGPYQDSDTLDNPYYVKGGDASKQAIPGNGIGYDDDIKDNERFGMRRFVYYNNARGNQGDPTNQIEHYNYLRGLWKDGVKFQYGGNAYPGTGAPFSTSGVDCDFMFPSDPATGENTDPEGWGTGGNTAVAALPWSEVSEGNAADDRRFVQSAGPFTLEPGAVNNITVGVVYGRSTSGYLASIAKMKQADDKAQRLFDNCFEILEGPNAPKLTIQELNKELILTIDPNALGVNIEKYSKLDPTIDENLLDSNSLTTDGKNNYYAFEGYQIFQLKDKSVSASDIRDIDKSRLVAQYDIKNGVKQLINYSIDPILGVGAPELMANGTDEGIKHSLRVTEDLFAKGDKRLINHKTYYFLVIAYAYNNYKTYDPTNPDLLDGQQKPYLASRKGYDGDEIASYLGVPHIPTPEAGGTVQNANYGDGVEITRIEGMGNGGREIDLTNSSRLEIARNYKMDEITYAAGKGPVDIKVIDPLNLNADEYELRFNGDNRNSLDSSTWELKRLSDDSIISSDESIVVGNEQLFPQYGFSINIEQYLNEIKTEKTDNKSTSSKIDQMTTNLITWSLEYEDDSKPWLSGLSDQDGNTELNWIRSGTQLVKNSDTDPDPNEVYDDYQGVDDQQQFENIANGTFAPFFFMSSAAINNQPIGAGTDATPSLSSSYRKNRLAFLPSIDIVFTKDKSLWTRCPVLETQDNSNLAVGGAKKLKLRESPSIDKDGYSTGDSKYNSSEGDLISSTGMGWFPGYAIDIETGERLNLAYGEDSWLAGDNGRDMIFNPTSTSFEGLGNIVAGGKHFLYVFRNNELITNPPLSRALVGNSSTQHIGAYDEGKILHSKLTSTSSVERRRAWDACVWVGIPMTASGQKFLSTDAILKIRVETPYKRYATKGNVVKQPTDLNSNNEPASENNWFNLYRFDTRSVATGKKVLDTAISVLDLINVVPNPYYAYSNYETSRLDSRIKITNLQEKCTIRIYNTGGSLVRTLTKDDPTTSIDWDLKNVNGVPIAGGLYIIHIQVPDVGEKIVKWFGAIRPPDLTNF
ncbi:MAG: T9SS C-terminal target domain-containing protein, partial [Flavobacteriales bacterium]